MHWEEFEQTWSKRRRLAREKNELESARVGMCLIQCNPLSTNYLVIVPPLKSNSQTYPEDVVRAKRIRLGCGSITIETVWIRRGE